MPVNSSGMKRDSFAFEDGKRSILRGFAPDELRQHLEFVALGGRARVHALLPGRLVVVGEARCGMRDAGCGMREMETHQRANDTS